MMQEDEKRLQAKRALTVGRAHEAVRALVGADVEHERVAPAHARADAAVRAQNQLHHLRHVLHHQRKNTDIINSIRSFIHPNTTFS